MWDIFDNESDDNGSGGALDAIQNVLGIAAGAYAINQITNSSTPLTIGQSGISTGQAAVYQAKQPTSTLLWLVVLLGIGVYAFKKA